MKQKISIVLIGACLLWAQGIYAEPTGEVKADTCLGCHGVPSYTNVYPSYHVPRLAGQHREYLIAALTAYQNGERSHPTMSGQAKTLSEKDIADVAEYFSKMESAPANPEAEIPPEMQAKAGTCSACHMNDGNSMVPNFPKIAGQREDYLYQSLMDYKSGARNNPIMLGIVAALSDEDMKDLARYFSKQPGLGTVSVPIGTVQ